MSTITDRPGQDLPDPTLPGAGGNDVVGVPDGGRGFEGGIGNDLPTRPAGTNPANEPDPTRPGPAVPGLQRTN